MRLGSAVSAIGSGAPFYVAQVRQLTLQLHRAFNLYCLHVPVNCLSATSPDATGRQMHLPVFAPPSFLSSCSSCNLWLNGPSTVTSTFHFDSYNNFLCMCDYNFEILLHANKSVTFASRLQIHWQQNRAPARTLPPPQLPSLVALAQRRDCQHEIVAHAIKFKINGRAATCNTLRVCDLPTCTAITVFRLPPVLQGDVCFIPEGWWHEVRAATTIVTVIVIGS
jgi:hypothetical protein